MVRKTGFYCIFPRFIILYAYLNIIIYLANMITFAVCLVEVTNNKTSIVEPVFNGRLEHVPHYFPYYNQPVYSGHLT